MLIIGERRPFLQISVYSSHGNSKKQDKNDTLFLIIFSLFATDVMYTAIN